MINHTKELAAERLEHVQQLVRENGVVRVDDLCDQLGVSPATVRRDLESLEQAGRIRRVHGGAMSVGGRLEEPFFDDKASLALAEKRAIARKALSLVERGDTLYLDGGSTVLELARLLHNRDDLTVVTHSLRAALALEAAGPRLLLVGGELRRRSQTMVGPLTRLPLTNLHVDHAFMGTMGLTLHEGMTTTDPAEAYTKQLVMDSARHVTLLADSSKIGAVSFAFAGALDALDRLITDTRADQAFLRELRKLGVALLTVSTKD